MSIEIRKARAEDSAELTRIAHAAKRHWGYPERWIEIWKDTLTITPDFISDNEVYLATVDGKIAGFYALLMLEGKASLEHLWVLPEKIGTGLGKTLFEHAQSTAGRLGLKAIEIESDPNAEGFYKKMGAKRTGEITSEMEGQPRVLPLLLIEIRDTAQPIKQYKAQE